MTGTTRIAIYDMDLTITRRATFTPFLMHALRRCAPWRVALVPVAGLALAAFALRLIDRGRLKEVLHALLLGRALPAADLARLADSFADTTVETNVLAKARAAIAADRARGCRLVLATASYAIYAKAIAARLGFDDIVATQLVADRGRVRTRIDGANCYGNDKLAMVDAWMHAAGLARATCHVRAYSDHVSDSPLLDWADEGVVVNGHASMRDRAAQRGWRIEDWA